MSLAGENERWKRRWRESQRVGVRRSSPVTPRIPPAASPLVRSLDVSLSYGSPVARFPASSSLLSLADKESGTKKKKRAAGGGERVERSEGGREARRGTKREVRKTCPSLHDPVHSPPTVPTITLEERAAARVAKHRAENTWFLARSFERPRPGLIKRYLLRRARRKTHSLSFHPPFFPLSIPSCCCSYTLARRCTRRQRANASFAYEWRNDAEERRHSPEERSNHANLRLIPVRCSSVIIRRDGESRMYGFMLGGTWINCTLNYWPGRARYHEQRR